MGRIFAAVLLVTTGLLGGQASAVPPPPHATFAVSLAVASPHGTTHPAGEIDFHRLGLTFNVPLRAGQTVNEGLVPGHYTVTASAPHAACPEKKIDVTLTSRPATFRIACVPIPACSPHQYDGRCTMLGLLGPWSSARAIEGGSTLVVSFTGHCGDDPTDPYRAHVSSAGDRVVVDVYGSRPFSNLCAASRSLTVYLAAPLGSRVVVDGFDGARHL